MFHGLCEKYGEDTAESLFETRFANYGYLDIIDTGMGDCYSEAFVEMAQRRPDRLRTGLHDRKPQAAEKTDARPVG